MGTDGYDVYAEQVEVQEKVRHANRRVFRNVITRPARGTTCHLVVNGLPICRTTASVQHIPEMAWVNVRPDQRCGECSRIAS
jgi:hypothetical protein